MALPPIVAECRRLAAEGGEENLPLLDLACGTGRFLLQIHRTLPRVRLWGLDLSPYYVRHAGRLLAAVKDKNLLCENAESTSLRDGIMAVVSCVFLLHELPADARRNVVREALRLLRPGGLLVVCDSIQLSDFAELFFSMDLFERTYHEPYYKSYIRDDLSALLREAGFTVESAQPHFVSKIVVGRKPA